MSANPYQASSLDIPKQDGAIPKSVTFAIYCGVVSAATIGVLALGLMTYGLFEAISRRDTLVEYISGLKIAALPLLTAPFLLAFGIYKRSRVCAALSAMLYSGVLGWSLVYDGVSFDLDLPGIALVSLTCTSILGVVGTILHHRRTIEISST